MIAPSDDGYSVREGNLEAIAAAISGGKTPARRKAAVGVAPKAKTKGDGNAARRSTGNPIKSNIDAWIKDGFFKSPRTLHAVHHRLHEHGVIARQTSVSGPLLRAVQQRRMKRQKIMENAKRLGLLRHGSVVVVREELERNLSSKIEPRVVADILNAYEGLIQKHRALDAEAALTRPGKFVEHIFRALEFIRTGTAPAEIKSPAATAKLLENDTSLPEPIRMLVPRIALAMVYDLRSKRGAVHVKEIDPRGIDVDLAAKAASWIVAELIRLYHVDDENAVRLEMTRLLARRSRFWRASTVKISSQRKCPRAWRFSCSLAVEGAKEQHAPNSGRWLSAMRRG